MLRVLAFLVVIGVGFVLGRFLYASPTAWVPDQVHDFGRVTSTGKLRHTFEFRNWSFRPLQISRVRTSCGCTVAKHTKAPIPPLGTGQVETELDLEGKSAAVETDVYLEFGSRGKSTFVLRADVVPLSPSKVDMGRILRGHRTSRTFALASVNGSDPLQVEGHHFSQPGLRAEFARDDEDPARVRVTVSVTDEIATGPLLSVMTVDTTDTQMPQKEVRFVGFVVPPVEATPSQVSLGYFGPDTPASETLVLRSPYGDVLELARVEMPGDWVEWRQESPGKPGDITITISTKGSALASGLHSENAVFHVIVNGSEHSVPVRIFGFVFANDNPFAAPAPAATP